MNTKYIKDVIFMAYSAGMPIISAKLIVVVHITIIGTMQLHIFKTNHPYPVTGMGFSISTR